MSGPATESVFKMDPGSISATFEAAPQSLRFAASVAEFGEILRKSPHTAGVTFAEVEKVARAAAKDRQDQQELLDLLHRADSLSGGKPLTVAKAAP